MYYEPKKLFTRIVLLFLLGIAGVVVSVVLTSGGVDGFIGVIVLFINIVIIVMMLIILVISIVYFIRYLLDKENENGVFMYLFNMIVALVVLGGFLIFYFVLLLGTLVVLLPFLA